MVVDYFSRYFEVVILRSTSSTRIIEGLKPIFARFGVPHMLKTDNGPQLVSEEFETFLAENGIEHKLPISISGCLQTLPFNTNFRDVRLLRYSTLHHMYNVP